MNRLASIFGTIGLLALLAIWPSQGQAQSNAQRPSMPPSISTPRTPGTGPSTGTMDQTQGPVYVGGRIVMESGQPVPESVSVELYCGMRPLQAIRTDLGGYFTFSLGSGGAQGNMDFSASDDAPFSTGNTRGKVAGGFNGSVTGCELHVSVPGFHPMTYTLSQPTDLGRIDVGTLRLQRIAGVEGSAISVTSLLVPSAARKEYEKAEKESRGNHPDAARQHLEKAVAEYDKYAAAWNDLGKSYLSAHDTDKARTAFQKAIAADPQYTPPYLNLAMLELQSQHYENAVDTADKLLQLDSSDGFASFVQAVGNFNLNRLDAAEKSAQDAEKEPHQNNAQVHALLAQIFLRKQDYPRAAAQMREYLQEAPHGQYAEQMKKDLQEIQDTTASTANQTGTPADPTAPAQEPEANH